MIYTYCMPTYRSDAGLPVNDLQINMHKLLPVFYGAMACKFTQKCHMVWELTSI